MRTRTPALLVSVHKLFRRAFSIDSLPSIESLRPQYVALALRAVRGVVENVGAQKHVVGVAGVRTHHEIGVFVFSVGSARDEAPHAVFFARVGVERGRVNRLDGRPLLAARGEDLPYESQVRGLPNVILTPHIGGSTLEAQESIAQEVASKLASFVLHGSTTGSVNVPEVELPGRPDDPGADEPSHHRLLHFHRNVPGVLSKLHAIVAEIGANITGEYLRTNNEIGYVVLDTDPTAGAALAERIATIEETIRVRVIA